MKRKNCQPKTTRRPSVHGRLAERLVDKIDDALHPSRQFREALRRAAVQAAVAILVLAAFCAIASFGMRIGQEQCEREGKPLVLN